jgi:two-component system, NtrC family, sensor kinase
VLNLLLNASHAIADALLSKLETKGLIKISTVEVEGTIEVRITDTGLGIPAAIRHRVFEPFFTTKDVGKGTGQGLAHAHAVIVQQHKGLIDFQSTPGVGTCFTLKLPLKAPKTTAIGAIATDNHD